ncbi:PAS domain S-box protein [Adhaeribacter radiodurans]|uniref:histidine kinase n=1 Tax=Adhaeribacter radiodurans TaxID=2745197 RepID=A0A7L7L705_9BACT|nr:PAS domain S-box protein [Adhaeribacter radiodurans]QMU28616.1 PAS domain S-box protein [Adhaeribacter radiodurans]
MTVRRSLQTDGKFRALVENTPDTVVVADDSNKIIFSNNKIFSTFGYQPEEVLNQPLTLLLPPAYRDIYEVEFSRFIKNYKNRGYNPISEVPGCCKDGSIFPAEISLSVWHEENHMFSSVIIRDVSERKKYEENLESEREFLKGILDSAEDIIIGCDENGVVNFHNESARTKQLISSFKSSHLNSPEKWLKAERIYQPDGITLLRLEELPLYRALKGENVKNQELIIRLANNRNYLLIANGRQIVCKEGIVKGAVIVLHDITTLRENTNSIIEKNQQLLQTFNDLKDAERKLIEANNLLELRVNKRTQELTAKNQKLNYYNEALQKANIDLDNFIHIASHDLKVPIVNMEALLKILHQVVSNESEDALDIIDKLEISVGRMKKSIQAISEVAKVQKQIEYQSEIVDLTELLVEITESIAEQIKAENVQLEYDFSEVPAIRFSYINLKSILYNLITNAIKYKAPDRDPHIIISTHVQPDGFILHVRDNGLGIDLEKNGAKLFTMFSRLHDHVEGSGIGLYIIKRIIENADGTIEVSSQLGVGSTFTVCLKD